MIWLLTLYRVSLMNYSVEEAKKLYPGYDPLVYWVLDELDCYCPTIPFATDAHKRIQEALEAYALKNDLSDD